MRIKGIALHCATKHAVQGYSLLRDYSFELLKRFTYRLLVLLLLLKL